MEPSTVAGIAIPDSTLARDATAFVRDIESDLLYHHAVRVFVFGSLHGGRRGLAYDPELLYVAALFHDVGLVEGHRTPDDGFELDGANAARDFLDARGVTAEAVRVVWDAIALHTTPGIAKHLDPEVALLTAGVELDVLGLGHHDITDVQRDELLGALPRRDFDRQIIQAFGAGLTHEPQVTLGDVTEDVLAHTFPGYRRPGFCEAILAAPFSQ